jgi:hypothetical protein
MRLCRRLRSASRVAVSVDCPLSQFSAWVLKRSFQAVPCRGRAGLRRTACAAATSRLRLPGGRAPEGRWPCAGKGSCETWGGHPRWPQIVLASPNGVNPAARPDPVTGQVERLGGSRRGLAAGSGVPG